MNKTIKTLKQIIASRRAARHIVSSWPQMPLETMPDPTVKAPVDIPPMPEVEITDVREEAPEAADAPPVECTAVAEPEETAAEPEEAADVPEEVAEDSTKSSRKRKKKKSKS